MDKQYIVVELDTGEVFVYSGYGNMLDKGDKRKVVSLRFTTPIPEERISFYSPVIPNDTASSNNYKGKTLTCRLVI
jgi:hypothetical protein